MVVYGNVFSEIACCLYTTNYNYYYNNKRASDAAVVLVPPPQHLLTAVRQSRPSPAQPPRRHGNHLVIKASPYHNRASHLCVTAKRSLASARALKTLSLLSTHHTLWWKRLDNAAPPCVCVLMRYNHPRNKYPELNSRK